MVDLKMNLSLYIEDVYAFIVKKHRVNISFELGCLRRLAATKTLRHKENTPCMLDPVVKILHTIYARRAESI